MNRKEEGLRIKEVVEPRMRLMRITIKSVQSQNHRDDLDCKYRYIKCKCSRDSNPGKVAHGRDSNFSLILKIIAFSTSELILKLQS